MPQHFTSGALVWAKRVDQPSEFLHQLALMLDAMQAAGIVVEVQVTMGGQELELPPVEPEPLQSPAQRMMATVSEYFNGNGAHSAPAPSAEVLAVEALVEASVLPVVEAEAELDGLPRDGAGRVRLQGLTTAQWFAALEGEGARIMGMLGAAWLDKENWDANRRPGFPSRDSLVYNPLHDRRRSWEAWNDRWRAEWVRDAQDEE